MKKPSKRAIMLDGDFLDALGDIARDNNLSVPELLQKGMETYLKICYQRVQAGVTSEAYLPPPTLSAEDVKAIVDAASYLSTTPEEFVAEAIALHLTHVRQFREQGN